MPTSSRPYQLSSCPPEPALPCTPCKKPCHCETSSQTGRGERTERCQWQKKRGERVAAVKISSVRRKAAQKFWAPQQGHPYPRPQGPLPKGGCRPGNSFPAPHPRQGTRALPYKICGCRGGPMCPAAPCTSCNVSLRDQFANWSWQSASPVSAAPCLKGAGTAKP